MASRAASSKRLQIPSCAAERDPPARAASGGTRGKPKQSQLRVATACRVNSRAAARVLCRARWRGSRRPGSPPESGGEQGQESFGGKAKPSPPSGARYERGSDEIPKASARALAEKRKSEPKGREIYVTVVKKPLGLSKPESGRRARTRGRMSCTPPLITRCALPNGCERAALQGGRVSVDGSTNSTKIRSPELANTS